MKCNVSHKLLFLIFILCLTVISNSVSADSCNCKTVYQSLKEALQDIRIERGIQQKISSKVENAWRMHKMKKNTTAIHQLDIAEKMLNTEPTKRLPEDIRNLLLAGIYEFRNCIRNCPGDESASLIIYVFNLDETAPDFFGQPAGEGVYIRVNGYTVTTTRQDGTALISVPSGTMEVTAVVPSSAIGTATITVAAGETRELRLLLDDGKEVVEDTPLTIDELNEGIIPWDFESFSLRFIKDGDTVPLCYLDEIEIIDPITAQSVFIEEMFSLDPSGAILIKEADNLRALLLQFDGQPIDIRAQGVDNEGFTHDNTVRIYLGRFNLSIQLTPPPSCPELNVTGIPVQISLLGTDLVFYRTSDANGGIMVEYVPMGNIAINSETFLDGKYYYGQSTLFLDSKRSIILTMRNMSDILNYVPSVTQDFKSFTEITNNTVNGVRSNEFNGQAERNSLYTYSQPNIAVLPDTMSPNATASVSVTAGLQNIPSTDFATLTIPKGTKKVTLTYNVYTEEYPVYVMQQSIYNDVWSLNIFGGAGGMQLFEMIRNVNSQLTVPPIWQGDGSTGNIKVILDTAALTTDQETIIILCASSTNIGDSLLPTSVNAVLSTEISLQINSISPDTVIPTKGDSSYYSIPRPGEQNTYERFFTLNISKPEENPVTRVKTWLVGNSELMMLLDEEPGENITVVDNETLRVRVTLHSQTSTVFSQPPPTHTIKYRFEVFISDNSGTQFSDKKDSEIRNALWRIPDSIPRCGYRDPGGDNWASRGAYNWMVQNQDLLTRVDDVSGEHARDIGHNTHAHGTDFDMSHFYTFSGAVSGTDNYHKLRDAVFDALSGNTESLNKVISWVDQTRQGLNPLLALDTVDSIYYMIGDLSTKNNNTLPRGWAQQLLCNGALTTAQGEVLDLGIDNWTNATNAKMRYNSIHNNHIHITLNRTQINN